MLRSKSMEAHRPSLTRRISSREKKLALLQDVDRLKKKLRHEENVHRALERAFTRPLGTLPRLPPYLPPYTLELLAEVAVLEEEVVRLEEQVVHFRKGLYLEAANISSSKKSFEKTNDSNDLCLVKSKVDVMGAVQAETKLISSSNPQTATPKNEKLVINITNLDDGREKENQSRAISMQNKSHSPKQKPLMVKTSTKTLPSEKKTSEKKLDPRKSQLNFRYDSQDHVEAKSPCLRDENPNLISENILSCLLSIFSGITTSNKRPNTENFPPSIPSPFLEDDGSYSYENPYDVGPRFGKNDIGPYKHMCIVDGQSINVNTKSRSLSSFRRLRMLVKKLASVKLHSLTHQEKLAFWINVYNSCMMNGYLEHGIPENPEKVVELMQKATINVGGRMLNAITIEHFILRLPYHSKYTFSKGIIKDGMIVQNTFGLELSEPFVTFALSCGSWSSPAVRIYTASEVENELEVAKREYLQAAISISSKNKVIIPKLLDWYLLDFAKDLESLLDWICLQLPTPVRKDVMKCLERSKNGPLSQIVHFLPYNFSFRYILHRSN